MAALTHPVQQLKTGHVHAIWRWWAYTLDKHIQHISGTAQHYAHRTACCTCDKHRDQSFDWTALHLSATDSCSRQLRSQPRRPLASAYITQKICMLAHHQMKVCKAGATISSVVEFRGRHIPACHVFDLALVLTYQTRFVLPCKDVLVDGPAPYSNS